MPPRDVSFSTAKPCHCPRWVGLLARLLSLRGSGGCRRLGLSILWAGAMIAVASAPARAESAAEDPPPVARVIRSYALTSANDFPERDPQNWRLLGSNDDQTWTVLDVRQGVVFSERHERRVFVCSNCAPFTVYRLEIDRVHAPSTANAVQLAEIEPMNDYPFDPSPAPLFCDAISAQGDNPPEEMPDKLFDKLAHTKWLDFGNAHPESRASWVEWKYCDHRGVLVTNFHDLNSLGSRAAEDFGVRIDGYVAGLAADGGKIYLMDESGFMEMPRPEIGPRLCPGQKVRLTGESQWSEAHVAVRGARLEALASVRDTKPWRITGEEPMAEDDEFRWAQAEGEAHFVTRADGALTFDLTQNNRRIAVHVLQPESGKSLAEGIHVRVEGLCGGLFNKFGTRVAGIMWIPNLDAISLFGAGQGPAPTNAATPEPVVGAGTALTEVEQIRHLSWSSLPVVPQSNEPFTNYGNAPRVDLRGVVTEAAGGCMQDATGGIEIWVPLSMASQAQALGSFIEVKGQCVLATGHGAAGQGPVVEVESLRRLGIGELPDPIRPSWGLLASGQMDAQWVEVDAVVRDTDGSHLLLACESGQLAATIREAPVETVNNLLDATIRVRGVCIAATDRGQMQGVELLVPSLEYVQILQPPAAPETMAARPIASLGQIRGPREAIHRVKVEGVLTCIENDNYTIQDASGGAVAIAKQKVVLHLPAGGWWTFWQSPQTNPPDPSLHLGDTVEAVGFPDTRGYAPVLTEATLQTVKAMRPIKPVMATAEAMSTGDLDATLVTVEGLVQGSENLGPVLALQIQSGLKAFRAILPADGKARVYVATGARVRLTGVCEVEPAAHAELGRHAADFSLRLRNASDIALLELPPWLSLRRALEMVGALIVVLLAAFVWIRLLHREVAVRTQQLEEKIAEHERTETLLAGKTQLLETEIEERKRAQAEIERIHKQLLTTSRLAGMADVATNVLHNVGNVLNSVNVLTASIAVHLKKSRVGAVSKVATLLAQHDADLGHFLSEDPQGRLAVGHLGRLGTHLTEEQQALQQKIKSLAESLVHIKEIVAMQQNYAKVSGLRETAALADVVEDALRMCSGGFARHGISVRRDYEELPPVTLDRHKTLQILFNLLDNAKHACWENNGRGKEITVRIRRHGTARARIEVIDNGAGIEQANLGRIFTQGFSTRKGGHGFGLHSSILAAQDMGGDLTAQSDGAGKGSTFTLEMPLTPTAEEPEPGTETN